jgi:molecular chaperone Hsp33
MKNANAGILLQEKRAEMEKLNTNSLIFNEPDHMLRMTLFGGQARVMLCRTTRMVQQAADIHQASDVATAAMGRVLPGTAMLSVMLKDEESSVTLTMSGDGPGGRFFCVGRGGELKITCDNPQVELPVIDEVRQDVAGFIGRNGRLTVVKDFGKGEPYTGSVQLVSGEVAEDLAQYYKVSEQTPTILALGCLNQSGVVLSSGGILVQALPGCSEEVIMQLDNMLPFFAGISREIYDLSLNTIATTWFRDMDLEILEESPLSLSCDCSREKMAAALVATGKHELEQMIAEQKDVELVCWFCRAKRNFTPEDLTKLLEKASKA